MSTRYRLDSEAVLNGIAYDAARQSPVRHRKALAPAFRDRSRGATMTCAAQAKTLGGQEETT
jgi:hypothetical protein